MFDFNDNELIVDYVNKRKEGAYVSPLYVSIYNERYPLSELDKITDYSPASMKVGFAGCRSVLEKFSFPSGRLNELNVVNTFGKFNSDNNIETQYIVFETGYMDNESDITAYSQINYYVEMLNEYIDKHVKEYKKKVANEFMESLM
jgi:hypothetical protein